MAINEGVGEPSPREVYCSAELRTQDDAVVVIEANPDNADRPAAVRTAFLTIKRPGLPPARIELDDAQVADIIMALDEATL